ncbi:MAG: site-specific integrase [Acetatifactor sp.]|nr:site-specific integrase [Acetatifactor sp.]
MNNLQTHINRYLEYCRYQKRLDEKTLKAYQIDLTQFFTGIPANDVEDITPSLLEVYIAVLHQQSITITPDQ